MKRTTTTTTTSDTENACCFTQLNKYTCVSRDTLQSPCTNELEDEISTRVFTTIASVSPLLSDVIHIVNHYLNGHVHVTGDIFDTAGYRGQGIWYYDGTRLWQASGEYGRFLPACAFQMVQFHGVDFFKKASIGCSWVLIPTYLHVEAHDLNGELITQEASTPHDEEEDAQNKDDKTEEEEEEEEEEKDDKKEKDQKEDDTQEETYKNKRKEKQQYGLSISKDVIKSDCGSIIDGVEYGDDCIEFY